MNKYKKNYNKTILNFIYIYIRNKYGYNTLVFDFTHVFHQVE